MKYVGQMEDGSFNGKGIMYRYDLNGKLKSTLKGWWKNGKYLGEK